MPRSQGKKSQASKPNTGGNQNVTGRTNPVGSAATRVQQATAKLFEDNDKSSGRNKKSGTQQGIHNNPKR